MNSYPLISKVRMPRMQVSVITLNRLSNCQNMYGSQVLLQRYPYSLHSPKALNQAKRNLTSSKDKGRFETYRPTFSISPEKQSFYPPDLKKVEYKRLNIINILAHNETKSRPLVTPELSGNELAYLQTTRNINSTLNEETNNVFTVAKIKKVQPSYFFQYSRINEYKKLGVELASPETIRKWAERILPTGRIVGVVLNANTLHHKTLKPLKGGLFCERIFGPSKDFRCACGKTITKRMRLNPNTSYSAGVMNLLTPKAKPLKRFFCKVCEVEYTWALTRRYQLGYISLAFPVTHIWFTKGFSSPISLLFDIHKYDLDSIIYCSQTTSIEKSYELTEMGISSKATQLLSFTRKTRAVNKLNQQQLHLVTLRSDKRNKIRFQTLPETKKIKDFESLHTELHQISQTIQHSSLAQLFNLKPFEARRSSREKTKLLVRRHKELSVESKSKFPLSNILDSQTTTLNSDQYNGASNHSFPSSFFMRSLIFPLVAAFAVQDFAPFILWLLTVENSTTKRETDKQVVTDFNTRINILANLSSSNLSSSTQTVSPQVSNKETKMFESLTEQLVVLKTMLITSLQLLQSLPVMIERKYHKYLINSRSDLVTLPRTAFKTINQQLYKTSYQALLKVMKNIGNSLKTETFSYLSKEKQNFELDSNFTDVMYTVRKQQTKYFITQVKRQLQIIKPFDRTRIFNLEFDKLALQFLLYKMKKQPLFGQSTDFVSPMQIRYNSLLQVKSTSFNRQKSPGKSAISFYYNLYGIADDHLWENINDWNLTKSFLTLCPDIMDRVIPAYKHRIPSTTMTHLDSTESSYIYSKFEEYYLKPVRKYQRAETTQNDWASRLNQNKLTQVRFTLFVKPISEQQALPIKSTGAGIINNLLSSISLGELEAMDKQFSLLLRESRKKILNYKTKLFSIATEYTLTDNHLSLDVKNSTLLYPKNSFGLSDTNITNKILHFSTSQKTRQQESQLISITGGRIDRYSGIDKLMEKHHDLLRRAKIIRKFFVTKLLPKTMILKVLPVLPPDLRPIMKMGDQIATSDLNRLYQRVLYRNERLNKIVLQLSDSTNFGISTPVLDNNLGPLAPNLNINLIKNRLDVLDTPLFGYEKHYAQRLLQEAVDNLIDNGRAGANSEKDAKGRALKSLSEVLKGKQGRFRQYLLGKRVDYSGRSVIVVGPKLKIHQCGLPREMAVELYLPFIIQYLIQMKYTKTVVGAKTLIAKNKELINIILDNVVRGHPIILNRAPTLHRLGFQAFQPILVDGRAILLHPMACTAFNADFDGDQMAVHIPITIEARSEAWRLMLARNNLLSPATGDPIILPSQDMVLGCYYLTTTRKMKLKYNLELNQYFSDLQSVLYLYYLGKLHIHTPIWVKTTKKVISEARKKPLEIRISMYGTIQEIYSNAEYYYSADGTYLHQYIRTTPGRILFNLIIKKD